MTVEAEKPKPKKRPRVVTTAGPASKAAATAEVLKDPEKRPVRFGPSKQDRIRARRRELAETVAAEPLFVPDPAAAVANAARLREFRQGLVERGALTVDQLAEGRRQKPGAARKWLERRVDAGELFTVKVDGRVLVPLSLLDATFDPIPAWSDVLAYLNGAELEGWALWAWIDAPHSLLSGEVPSDLIASDPDRVVLAARRYAQQLLG